MKSRRHASVYRRLRFACLPLIFLLSVMILGGVFSPKNAGAQVSLTLTADLASPQQTLTPITLSAHLQDGSSVLYCFLLDGATLQNYSTLATCVWIPTTAGLHRLQVTMRDLAGNEDTSSVMTYQITAVTRSVAAFTPKATAGAALTGVTLTANPSATSPITINTSVSLLATANGGSNVQFRFMVNETIIQDFSSTPTVTWIPSIAGTYTVLVEAEDLNSANPTGTYSSSPLTFTVTPLLSGVTLSGNPSSPQVVTTPITLSAAVSGGAAPLYQFVANNQVIRDYAATATCQWTPASAGTYTLIVNVEDPDSPNPSFTLTSAPITYTITATFSPTMLTASPPSPQLPNTAIMLQSPVVNGGEVVYQFLANATVISDYGSASSCIWTPSAPGVYALTVNTRDLASANPSQTTSSAPLMYDIALPQLAATPPSPQPVTTPINLTATAFNGVNPASQLVYQFLANNTVIRDYGSASACTWTPASPGTYALTLNIRDLDSTNTSQTLSSTPLSYAITALPLTALPPSAQPVNTAITLTAPATGIANPVYQFLVNNSAIRDYSASASCVWIPSTPGVYSLVANIRALNSTNPSQTITSTPLSYTVVSLPPSVNLLVNPLSPCAVNAQVQLTAQSSGGSNLVYTFLVGNTPLSANSSSPTCTWTPTQAGTYQLAVTANGVKTAPLSYVVKNALSAVSLTALPARPQPVNSPITLQAQATGGAVLQYRFFITSSPLGQTVLLQDFSAASSCTWTPTVPGNYTLNVAAIDLNGADPSFEVIGTLNYTVTGSATGPFTVSLTVSPTPGIVNGVTTLTAKVSGAGAVNAEYRFRVGYQDALRRWCWQDLQQYSSALSCTWTPKSATTYSLVVWALKAGSTSPYDATASHLYVVSARRVH